MVEVGLAVGLEIFGSLSPVVGNQLYVVPPLPFNTVLEPMHILELLPALATGEGLTVIETVAVDEQPAEVPVTV